MFGSSTSSASKMRSQTFLKVMRAVPPDQNGYTPHPRSTNAGDLMWLLAAELEDACYADRFGRGELRLSTLPRRNRVDRGVREDAGELQARLATLDDAKWQSKARMLMDGKPMWEATLGDMLFGFLFDAVHHRGQLSTYLRPMGAKVPSIYGPSGDDPGGSA